MRVIHIIERWLIRSENEPRYVLVVACIIIIALLICYLYSIVKSRFSLRNSNNSIQTLQTQLNEVNNIVTQTEVELKDKIQEVKALEYNVSIRQDEIVQLQNQLETKDEVLDLNIAELQKFKELLSEAEQHNKALEQNNYAVERRIIELSKQNDLQLQNINNLKSDNETLRKEQEDTIVFINENKDIISKLKSKITILEYRLAETININQTNVIALSEAKHKIDVLEQELDSTSKECQIYLETINQIKIDTETTINNLDKERLNLVKQLEDKIKENANVRIAKQELQFSNEALQKCIEELSNDKLRLCSEVENLKSELDVLHSSKKISGLEHFLNW